VGIGSRCVIFLIISVPCDPTCYFAAYYALPPGIHMKTSSKFDAGTTSTWLRFENTLAIIFSIQNSIFFWQIKLHFFTLNKVYLLQYLGIHWRKYFRFSEFRPHSGKQQFNFHERRWSAVDGKLDVQRLWCWWWVSQGVAAMMKVIEMAFVSSTEGHCRQA